MKTLIIAAVVLVAVALIAPSAGDWMRIGENPIVAEADTMQGRNLAADLGDLNFYEAIRPAGSGAATAKSASADGNATGVDPSLIEPEVAAETAEEEAEPEMATGSAAGTGTVRVPQELPQTGGGGRAFTIFH